MGQSSFSSNQLGDPGPFQLGSPNSQRPVPNHPATLLKQRAPATDQNIKKQAKLTAKHDETMTKPGFWSFRWMFFFFNKNQANIWEEGLRSLKQSDHAVEVGRFSRSHQTTSYKPTTLSMMCSNPLWLFSLSLWNPKVFQHFSSDLATWGSCNFQVVYLPLWKIWWSQLGWWNSQYIEKI